MPKRKFKSDRYRRARGGYSRVLEISCSGCDNVICEYQKDGPGPLKRMYLDRVMGALGAGQLECIGCRTLLGVRYIYEKENRPAFRMIPGSFKKRIVKL